MDGFSNGTRTNIEISLRNDVGGTMAVTPEKQLAGTAPSLPPRETLGAIRDILMNEGKGITQDANAVQMASDTYSQMRNALIRAEVAAPQDILQMNIDQIFQLYNQHFGGATGSEDAYGISMNQGTMPGMNVPNMIGKRLG